MRSKKNSIWKKTITLGSSLLLLSGACLGLGFGIHNLTTSIQKSSDFDSGHSFQMNLRLYQVDNLGKPILTNNQPTPIYADKQEEIENLKITAEALTKLLQNKKLTDIQVSFGYSTTANSLFPSGVENIAVLYANFENSITAFSLNDIKEEVNLYINNQKIFKTLTKTYNFELESVQSQYSYSGSFGGTGTTIESTQRNNVNRGEPGSLGGLYYNEKTQVASGSTLALQDATQTAEPIKAYTGDKIQGDRVAITTKEDLNSWAFVTQKNEYEALKPVEDTDTAALNHTISNYYQNYDWGIETQAIENLTDQDKYQTKNTWILWRDKQGLVNYLNGLIMVWYYNMYANIIPSIPEPTRESLDKIFNTTAFNYENYVVPELRDQINLVINGLSETEKSLICMLGTISSGKNPTTWMPQLITENDLIPILYSYYNNSVWNANYVNINEETSVPSYGYSQSVRNGWGWIESSNASALNTITGDYLETIIDYRNYNEYLADEEAKDTETDTDTLPNFSTKEFVMSTKDSASPKAFAEILNNSNKFDIIMPQYNEFIIDYEITIKQQLKELRDADINFNDPENPATIEYKEKRAALANKYFTSTNLFSAQNQTKPILVDSWVNFNSLYILLIVISAILFIIGIFISVRYRIPGFIAFINASFVFVVSAYLYNVFGFVFSFNTVIALVFSTFLSLLSPTFLFRNITKEVKENSTLNAAVIKSVKKYWKMSLDTHIIALLSSLSFLFFGIGGNINFGAMLVISVFLSFILSGIIFFILMLYYTQFYQFANSKWFFAEKLYQYYLNFDIKNAHPTKNWFRTWVDKYAIYTKFNYYSCLAFVIIGVIGCIVLGVVGPGDSLDFKQTNILTINNFANLNLSVQQVLQILNIKSIDAYVYANALTIYTDNNLELSAIINALVNSGISLDTLTNNVLTTTLTNSVAIQNVTNTLMCFGIAIGFTSVWAILSLNIVSVIPLVSTQVFNLMFIFGFFSIVRLPMDLPVLAIASFVFILSSSISASCLSSVKSSWNRQTLTSQADLKLLVTSIVKKIALNYWIVGACFAIFAILGMIFASSSLLFVFLLMLLTIPWIAYYSNIILMNVWYYCVIVRDLFNKELQKTSKKEIVALDYDTVNEQIITGINN